MTDWLQALADRAGPFLNVAQLFVAEMCRGDMPRGEHGVRSLALTLEAYCSQDLEERESAYSDDAFVEGAGALLALLLLDAFGGQGHQQHKHMHQLALGEWGWFDPFVVIQEALEAEEPARVLAHGIAQAEREAHGHGRSATVCRVFAETLADVRPDLVIQSRFGYDVTLQGGVSVNVERAAMVWDDERALLLAVRNLISMLPGELGSESANAVIDNDNDTDDVWRSEVHRRVLPRLVPSSFQHQGLYVTRWAADVSVVWVLVYENRMRFLRIDEAERIGCENLIAVAYANLAQRSEAVRVTRLETEGEGEEEVISCRVGDGFDAARIVLPTMQAQLTQKLGPRFCVGVPHRDALWACRNQPRAIHGLRQRVEEDFARAPHGISRAVFQHSGQGSFTEYTPRNTREDSAC